MTGTDRLTPRARQRRLVVKELGKETLVYDEDSHEAHCLNPTAAFVWKHCDGRTSVEQVARLLEREMKSTVPEQVVWLALGQLEKSGLLEEGAARARRTTQMSRRELVRRLGIGAAVALPLVTSIVAPTATEAQTISCTPFGEPCEVTSECCPGLTCRLCPSEEGSKCLPSCPS